MVNKCKDYIQAYSKKGLITEEAFWMCWGKGVNAPLTEEDELFIDACVFITPDVGRILTECNYKFSSTHPTFEDARGRAISNAMGRHPNVRLHSNQMFRLEVDVMCYVQGCERHRVQTLFHRNDAYHRNLLRAVNICGYTGDIEEVISNILPQLNNEWSLDYLVGVIKQVMGDSAKQASVVTLLPSDKAWDFFVNTVPGEARCTLEDYTHLRAFAYGWYLNGELVAVCPVWEPGIIPQHIIDNCYVDAGRDISVYDALKQFTPYLHKRYLSNLSIYCDMRDTHFHLSAIACGFTDFAGCSDNIARYVYTGEIPCTLK